MRFTFLFLASCAVAAPGGVLYEDPATHPCGTHPTICSTHVCCDEGFICGDPALPSCPVGAC